MSFLLYFITELILNSPTYKKNPEYISRNKKLQSQNCKRLLISFVEYKISN